MTECDGVLLMNMTFGRKQMYTREYIWNNGYLLSSLLYYKYTLFLKQAKVRVLRLHIDVFLQLFSSFQSPIRCIYFSL